MIPKIIHYCWFGGGKKSKLIRECVASWVKYMPEYKIIEWNEHNFDINTNTYVKEAYEKNKWAFVSDYVRAFALYSMGGIYLDTDVEIRKSLNPFLKHRAFSGFEKKGYPFTAVWGAEKGHSWLSDVLDYYNKKVSFSLETNTMIIADILTNKYRVNPDSDELQVLEDDIHIYPSSYFCLNLDVNYAVHHFEGSWLEKEENDYASIILHNYYKEKFIFNYKNRNVLDQLYKEKVFTKNDLFVFLIKKIKSKFLWNA